MSQSLLAPRSSLLAPRSSLLAPRSSLLAVLLISAAPAATVHVFFAGGQSNATSSWAGAIKNTLQAAPGAPQVEVVHNPHAGAAMWQWTWGGNRGANYNSDLAAIQAKIAQIEANGDTAVFSGLFWMQGESDTSGAAAGTIPLYQGRFLDLLEFYQQDLGLPALPHFTVGVIDLNPGSAYDDYALTGAHREDVDELRDVLFALGDLPNGSAVDSRGYTRSDAWHIIPAHQMTLGQAMANDFRSNFSVPEPSAVLLLSGGLVLSARRRRS